MNKNKILNKTTLPLILSCLIFLVLYILTINNCFFWDTVQLGSKHANFFYSNNFSSIILPNDFDSGHIPAFGMYLALFWKIFGRSLIICHIAMLPFVVGILWQLYLFLKRFVSKEYVGWAVLLVSLDPTLLSQITLISPDVPLVFFFLMALNSLFNHRKILLSLAVFGLFLTSMRGMMVSFCILIIDLVKNISFSNTTFKQVIISLLKRSLIYLPALLLFISFSVYHYLKTGWIGFHEDSPWAELFAKVDFKGFVFNIAILIWRILDFGRIGIWLVFFILLLKFKKSVFKQKNIRFLFFIFLIILVFLPINMIWANNLLGHRYLLPIYLSFSIFCACLLFQISLNKTFRNILIALWLIVITTGNLWIYPDTISQGWDSTLAHLPFYQLRQKTLQYLDDNNIDFQDVQSDFPNSGSIDMMDLSGDMRSFTDFNNCCEYVIYSNIYNLKDEIYWQIKNQYSLLQRFEKCGVYMEIRKKNVDAYSK